MKLLFDQNLSPRLVRLLADLYPESAHVHDLGMDEASDTTIWRYAGEQSYTIVSQDADFHQRSLLFGAPPKVIWLRVGNCTVAEAADVLREQFTAVERFQDEPDAAFLVLRKPRA